MSFRSCAVLTALLAEDALSGASRGTVQFMAARLGRYGYPGVMT